MSFLAQFALTSYQLRHQLFVAAVLHNVGISLCKMNRIGLFSVTSS